MDYLKFLFSTLGNIFINPAAAYRKLDNRPAAWFPLVLLVISWIVFWNWFYHSVDYAWLIERLVASETAAVPLNERAELAANVAKLRPGALIVISVFVTLAVLLLSALITSIYLVVVGAVYDDKPGLKDFFSFAMWAALTSLAAIALMVVNFTLSPDARLTAMQLNPVTLNNLIFHVGDDNAFKRLLDSIDLTLLWSQLVMIIGYRQWVGRSWLNASLVILTPFVVVYGIWAVVAAIP